MSSEEYSSDDQLSTTEEGHPWTGTEEEHGLVERATPKAEPKPAPPTSSRSGIILCRAVLLCAHIPPREAHLSLKNVLSWVSLNFLLCTCFVHPLMNKTAKLFVLHKVHTHNCKQSFPWS